MSKLDIEATKFKRRYSNYRDQLPDIGRENGVFVFPYELRSGYLNRTEKGYVWEDDEVDEYNFFQKLITGKDNINVVWEKSTTLIKPKGVNKYYYDFKVGTYYLGEIVGNEIFAETVFYDDDLSQKNIKVNNTVILHFVYNKENDYEKDFSDLRPFIVEKEDMFKLYKIPQLFGGEWMYISNVRYETIPNDNEVVGCFITFISLNEQLSKSGRMVESYIHESAPNEPYAKPTIALDKNEKGDFIPCIKLDENAKNFDRKMVKHIQIEAYGTNALSAITIIGRRLKKDEEGKLYFTNWQFLYPYSFIKPKTYDLEKTSTPSNNFYIFPNCTLDFITSINWIEQWKKVSDVAATNSYTGVLNIGYSTEWENLVHKSNPIDASPTVINGLHFDYWSLMWKPFYYIDVSQPYNLTKDNPYCINNLWFTRDDDFLNILIKNSFIYWQQWELPLGFSSTKPYKMSNIPIIGGMISALGGDRTIKSNKARKKTIPLCCIIDCAAATCGSQIIVGSGDTVNKKSIPLSFFGGEEVPKFLGVDVCNTTLCFSLTHLLIDGENKEWDSSYLGQTKNEELQPLYDGGRKPFLYDGTQKPKETKECYIIDKVIIQGLIKSDVKITFFDEDGELSTPLWTTKVQSQGKYTNSLRNWTTEINTGGWNGKYTSSQDEFTWPEYPVFGIIYNQSANNSPHIKTNVKGEYSNRLIDDEKFKPTDSYSLFTNKIKINFADIAPNVYDKASLKANVESISFVFEYFLGLLPIFSDLQRINIFKTTIKSHNIKSFIDNNYLWDDIFNYSNYNNKNCDFLPFVEQKKSKTQIESDEWSAWERTWIDAIYSIAGIWNGEWFRCGLSSDFWCTIDKFDESGFLINVNSKFKFFTLDTSTPLLPFYIGFYYSYKAEGNATLSGKCRGGWLNISIALKQINFELKSEEE